MLFSRCKLCHADAGLHRLLHHGDFEVAGKLGRRGRLRATGISQGSRDDGKNGRFSGMPVGKGAYPEFWR